MCERMTTDDRRARLIDVIASKLNLPNVFMGGPSPGAKIRAADIYDAIRESDEAAGMVLVPREATENMQQAGECAWMHRNLNNPNSNPLQDCYRAMIAAAIEKEQP